MSGAWQPPEAFTPLDGGRLDVWRVPLVEQPGDRALLAEDERERADRLVVPEKGRQFTAGRAALRRILGRYCGGAPESLRFTYQSQGKPVLQGFDSAVFNLSHSGELALVAVARVARLGVDVERCTSRRPLERLAARFFAEPEAREILALDGGERTAAFYRGWTRKEAYLKAWGTGLTFSSRRFRVTLLPDEAPRLVSTEMPGDDPRRWRFLDLVPAPDYRAAVCWEDEELRPRFFAAG